MTVDYGERKEEINTYHLLEDICVTNAKEFFGVKEIEKEYCNECDRYNPIICDWANPKYIISKIMMFLQQ